ncbi:hypothetical protein NDU88_002131 [Pleurodeles waltl]|uniref:Uncharacterized protein n=1 Tax=Pleurodeles waltl TaxID=8319 RepID=A0AAV7T1N5_PLEWA|nr:hypothetical protein NDU88_002131 [Pleurodeles waltl]
MTPGEAEADAACCLLRLRRGTPLVAPRGATTRLPRPAEGSLPGRPRLGRTAVTKHEQRWAEVRRAGCQWETPGEAEATYCLQWLRCGTPLVAPGGATIRLPSPAEGGLPEGPGWVQHEGCRKRRRDEGCQERAQKRTRRWKALVAWAMRTSLSESETI